MSKYDSKISAAAEVAGELGELLAALGRQPRPGTERQDAMAHFLSGADGWRDARKKLRGTFARPLRGEADGTDGAKK